MWKRKEESGVNPSKEVTSVSTLPQERKMEMVHESAKATMAYIGKSVLIKGELSSSEDLFIDGKVEGMIELLENNLSVGPNGQVHANISAKHVIILGAVKGNIHAVDRVDLKKSGSLQGDMVAARVVIEDGAYLKGSVDIQKSGKAATKVTVSKRADDPLPSDTISKFAGTPVEKKKFF